MNQKEREQKYEVLFGHVPENIATRYRLAEKVSRVDSIEIIEQWRDQLIYKSVSKPALQQLVHFALLIGSKDWVPAKLHALGALRAGASIHELWTVCETAAITGGMPMFSQSVEILSQALDEFTGGATQD